MLVYKDDDGGECIFSGGRGGFASPLEKEGVCLSTSGSREKGFFGGF